MIVFAITSFIIVAMGPNISTILLGVVCASISTGLGEITFLALTARYDKFVVYYNCALPNTSSLIVKSSFFKIHCSWLVIRNW